MTPIFYYLIPYVYYLIALTAMWQASFLHHLSSFFSIAYCSKVMCLLSALSSLQSYVSPLMTLSALQLCSSSQGHGSSYANLLQLLFTANFCCHDDVTAFGHRLRPEVLNMALKSETEAFQVQSLMSNQMTITPTATWLGYLVSESFSKLSEIMPNNLNRMSKNLMPGNRCYKFIYLRLILSA